MVKVESKEINVKITEKMIKKLLRDFAIEVLVQKFKDKKVLSKLCDGFANIEQHDLRVTDLVMNSVTYSTQIRKMANKNFDANTHASSLKLGLMGMLWGANVWVTRAAKINEISMYCEDDKVDMKQLKKDFPEISKNKKFKTCN